MVIAARAMAAGGIVAIIFVTQETKLCVWSGRRAGNLVKQILYMAGGNRISDDYPGTNVWNTLSGTLINHLMKPKAFFNRALCLYF